MQPTLLPRLRIVVGAPLNVRGAPRTDANAGAATTVAGGERVRRSAEGEAVTRLPLTMAGLTALPVVLWACL